MEWEHYPGEGDEPGTNRLADTHARHSAIGGRQAPCLLANRESVDWVLA